MKNRYRVFRRGWGTYYCEDLVTKKQETLKTRDKDEAFRLVAAKNENEDAPAFSLHLARVYWKAGEPRNRGATRASSEGLPVSMPSAIAGANCSRRNPG